MNNTNDIFKTTEEPTKDTNQKQIELDIVENEIQNYQDEILLEKQKQAKLQQQIQTLIKKSINNKELYLTEKPIWLIDLNKKVQHYEKIQQVLKLQVDRVEMGVQSQLNNYTDSQEDDQDKEALLKQLKEDLKNVNNELDLLQLQTNSRDI
ncbi:unnamed protein product [Cunninghamella blakesleeana]